MSFAKTAGLRSTEINLDSSKNLMEVKEDDIVTFRLLTLFNDQNLDIKNCMLEFEFFNDKATQNLSIPLRNIM